MSHPLEHPKAKELLKRVAQSIHSGNTYIVRDSKIIFVCGGPMHQQCMMRPKFCEFAKTELPNFRIFLAENAQKDYINHDNPEFLNVAEFEDVISEISTCIVLIPESPGSYAELGYFSNSKKIRKKLLVLNDAKLQGQDSFITLGPIGLIDKYSWYKPAIQISLSEEHPFAVIKQRIEKRNRSLNRRLFKVKGYKNLSFQDKFFQVFQIIYIFQAMTYDGIECAFRGIWGNSKKTDLHRILSILIAADYVRRISEEVEYFCVNREIDPFLNMENLNENYLIMEVVDFYDEHFPRFARIVPESEK